MSYQYADGGRVKAGMVGQNDCAPRAIAVACEMDYKEARKLLRWAAKNGRNGSGSISGGVYKEDMTDALASLGWEWISAPKFTGRKARYNDIPGTAILRMAKHFSVVIDGVLWDTFDCRESMVYGYWRKS